MAANSYDQYIGSEVVLPDWKCNKLMRKFRKRIKYDDIFTGNGHYNGIKNKYVYEVEYPGGITEQIKSNIIAENILSKFYSEGHHYQVLTEVTYHKTDGSDITKVDSLIKSSNGKLHQKRTPCGRKIILE